MRQDKDPMNYYALGFVALVIALILLLCSCTRIEKHREIIVDRQVIIEKTTVIQGQQGAMWTEKGVEI
jgi:hypothetical protein